MFTTRRGFLATTGLASAGLWLPATPAWALPPELRSPAPAAAPTAAAAATLVAQSPLPGLAGLARQAVERAKKLGASYADSRLVSMTTERVEVRDARVTRLGQAGQIGISVRVLVDGSWGFAATHQLDARAVQAVTDRAVAAGKAVAAARKGLGVAPIELAGAPAVQGTWVCPHQLDPFSVTPADKAELLLAASEAARKVAGVAHATAGITSIREDKLLVTTDGTEVHQILFRLDPDLSATAIDRRGGRFASRAHEVSPMLIGWEYIAGLDLVGAAPTVAQEALQKLHAPTLEPGQMHVILAPSNLYLTIHETIGHPTELDRVRGFEANLAGTSFLKPEDLNALQYAHTQVHVVADRTQPGGLATCAWDDEGVATSRWDLIAGGKLVGWQTTRDQASWIPEGVSHGCSYGEGYDGVQFQRMPNISLQPGLEGYTTEDLINATEQGVYITGRGSWSIDQQRYNFQFGGQMFWRVEKGRITGAVRDVAYQGNTLEFWRSCDMLGGQGTYRLGGTLGDGKGEPTQSNAVSHGCPPARFTAQILRTGGVS